MEHPHALCTLQPSGLWSASLLSLLRTQEYVPSAQILFQATQTRTKLSPGLCRRAGEPRAAIERESPRPIPRGADRRCVAASRVLHNASPNWSITHAGLSKGHLEEVKAAFASGMKISDGTGNVSASVDSRNKSQDTYSGKSESDKIQSLYWCVALGKDCSGGCTGGGGSQTRQWLRPANLSPPRSADGAAAALRLDRLQVVGPHGGLAGGVVGEPVVKFVQVIHGAAGVPQQGQKVVKVDGLPAAVLFAARPRDLARRGGGAGRAGGLPACGLK